MQMHQSRIHDFALKERKIANPSNFIKKWNKLSSKLSNSINDRTSVSTSKQKFKSLEELDNPVKIGATGSAAKAVKDYGGDVGLDVYMRLPVEQYFVLDPSRITWLGGTSFRLTVPRISFLSVWLEPTVEVDVQSRASPPSVVLRAQHCTLAASEPIASMHIDERFVMEFETTLTWTQGRQDAASAGSGSGSEVSTSAPTQQLNASTQAAQLRGSGSGGSSADLGAPRLSPSYAGFPSTSSAASSSAYPARSLGVSNTSQNGNSSSSSSSSSISSSATISPVLATSQANTRIGGAAALPNTSGEIRAALMLNVWCEKIPPFHLVPENVLQASWNTVLRGLIGTLLPLFLQQLAADYGRWAADPAYRASRAARSRPLH